MTKNTNNKENDLYRSLTSPLYMQVETTTMCTEKCIHCYNSWQTGNLCQNTLTEDNIKRIVNEIKQNKIIQVVVTGGEPLLFKDLTKKLIFELINYAKISCSLNSNLTHLDYDYAVLLKEIGLNSILTSLISYNEEIHDFVSGRKGNFKQVITGIKNALSAGLRVAVNMVLTKYNKDDVYKNS